MVCLGSLQMDCVISEPCYKSTLLQRNCNFTIPWLNSHLIFFSSHNILVLYLNMCYNEVCYKEGRHCIQLKTNTAAVILQTPGQE